MENRGFDMRQKLMQDAHAARKSGFGAVKQTNDAKELSIIQGLAGIGEDMKQHYPRISESRFKSRYLDAFAGYGDDREENYAIYLEWLQEVAKQYNIPVHVCADHDDRIILFTVPAMSNVQTVNPQKARNEEVQYAISRATQARHMQPYAWEAMLSQNLIGIYQKLYDKDNTRTEQNKVWADIFDRYADHFKGRVRTLTFEPTLMDPEDNEEPKPSSTVSSQTDFDEVEEEL